MAEVLEDRARTSDLWPMELHCKRCDSKIRVELGDLTYDRWKVGGYWFAGTEEIEDHFTYPCPACGHAFNPVERTLIPPGIQDDLMADYRRRKEAPGSTII